MTDKELRKLKRADLLEMMLKMQKELDSLNGERSANAADLKKELLRCQSVGSRRRLWGSIAVSMASAFSIIVLISAFLLPVYKVTGESMSPNLHKGDVVICGKYSDLERGDIVAFSSGSRVLIKRVIGLPGDVINMDADGVVTVNGNSLNEPYITGSAAGVCDIKLPFTVPENRYFVMGDDRAVSIDSRSSAVGCIADEFIAGKVIFRLIPPGALE